MPGRRCTFPLQRMLGVEVGKAVFDSTKPSRGRSYVRLSTGLLVLFVAVNLSLAGEYDTRESELKELGSFRFVLSCLRGES